MMFCYQTVIRLRDTDATGVLYFSELQRLALDAFEAYWLSIDLSLAQWIEQSQCLMPIVHAEADYFSPLRLSDEIEIRMALENIGTTSFSLVYHFYHIVKKVVAGKVKIVHVCVSRGTGQKIVLADSLIQQLRAMPQMPLIAAGRV
jgi:YbgC/YbaW family acyl-CoA thioester hydrolase